MSLDNGSSAVGMPELVVIRAAFVLEAVVLEKSDDLSSLDHPIPDPFYCQNYLYFSKLVRCVRVSCDGRPSWMLSARRVSYGLQRRRTMAVPCLADGGAAAISRASMITTRSYVSMACVQRGAPSNPAQLPRVSSAVSTFRATVSNAVYPCVAEYSNAFQKCGRHPPCADAARCHEDCGEWGGWMPRCCEKGAGGYSARSAGRISSQQPSGSSMK